ncbi:hypothetical protein KKD62_03340 [Patescibacteria group bacterium]|nr:hypothetical protein [Patescibacteria group bacterium]MBU1931321.1 hypothetical protein [Patescibacteria group bacterium]
MKKKQIKVVPEIIQNLVKVGLTKAEAKTYVMILKQGSSTVSELSQPLNMLPAALHRIIKNLQKKKLVTASHSFPKIIQTLPTALAFDALIKDKIVSLEQAKQNLIKTLVNPSPRQ